MRFIRVLILSLLATTGACALDTQSERSGSDEDIGVTIQATTQSVSPPNMTSYDLVMGANGTVVGTVYVRMDETCSTVYVKFLMLPGYELDEAHVCVSEDAFPWTAPGQCQYNAGTLPDGTTYYIFTIDVADVFGAPMLEGDGNFYLQAHATVSIAETDEHAGSAYAGYFKGQIAFAYSCGEPPPEEYGCTYTQGFWKTHPAAWPVSSLMMGEQSYTKTQAIQLFKTAPKGDASLILAHQLMAAMLNLASGSGAPDGVDEVMADAQAWMTANADGDGRLPYKVTSRSNKAAFEEGVSYAAALDLFNNGEYGPEHCGDETVVAPPPQ